MSTEQWLRSFLDKLAKKLEYKNHRNEIKKVSTGGANFTSEVFSSILAAPGKPDLIFFSKVASLPEELRSLIRFHVFNTENLFFFELVPRYKQLEDAYNVPEEERLLLPKCYGVNGDYMNEILVFENLLDHGFQNFDRFAYIDWKYASKCVEQLAILHSLSIAYGEKNPEELNKLTKHLKEGFLGLDLKHLRDICTTLAIKICNEDNKEKLRNFVRNNLNDETFEKFTKPERRPCLIHGDFRPSNIMHKVDKFLPYGLIMALILLPTVTLHESKIHSANDFLNGNISFEDTDLNLSQRLNDIINDFIQMGVL